MIKIPATLVLNELLVCGSASWPRLWLPFPGESINGSNSGLSLGETFPIAEVFDSPGPGNLPLARVAAKVAEKSAIASVVNSELSLGDSSKVSILLERLGVLADGGVL